MPVFVDTNVLVYARDTSDPGKHRTALDWMTGLWESGTGRLSIQVLQEYYVTVTRKLRPALSRIAARADVRDLLAWDPVPIGEGLISAAWAIEDRFALSFWDALVVGAATESDCPHLLTEDLQHGMRIGDVTVVSPFRAEPGTLS